ncbi:MAG: ABC transporter ATP-binding protein [Limisphaerales bacterium]
MRTASTPAIEIRALTRRFGTVTALDGVSLTIHAGEFFSLLGPSGCGKTTLLRLIAGLDVPDSGTLLIDGAESTLTPAHRRPVNTVFQSYALFPHLDVRNNVGFGLRMKKVARAEIARRVDEIMALVEISPLAARMPSQLSGGQKQRVALARALVNEPRVLLLDEPLAALDLKLRKQLQLELRNLQRRLGITFIHVTHDQEEALVLSDRIAVLHNGRIEQLGDARTLYERPRTRFVSQFLGAGSLIDGRLKPFSSGSDSFVAETALGDLTVAAAPPGKDRFTLAIRPEKIRIVEPSIARGEIRAENRCPARIEQRIYVGSETHYELRAFDQALRVETMNRDTLDAPLVPGQEVEIELPAAALVPLDD